MSDLISRQAAIDAICGECQGNCIPCEHYPCGEIKALEQLPSEQSEQKFGKWIVMDDDRISGRCSVCGWEAHMYEDDVVGMDYCPNCGSFNGGE